MDEDFTENVMCPENDRFTIKGNKSAHTMTLGCEHTNRFNTLLQNVWIYEEEPGKI